MFTFKLHIYLSGTLLWQAAANAGILLRVVTVMTVLLTANYKFKAMSKTVMTATTLNRIPAFAAACHNFVPET
jgi:hypothetical protein